MLNRTPPNRPPTTTNVISSYRKRRLQRGPLLVYGAIALVVVGVIIIAVSFFGGEGSSPISAMFATETPTATVTFTPTSTNTPTATATITETPTITFTPTPSEPFDYIIVEGDTLPALAEKFNLGDDGVLLLLDYNPSIVENNGIYFVGQTLRIPPPGTLRATATPIPDNLPRGTKIEYQVLPGDTLAGIAAKFNSKEEDIITLNKIEDANALQAGQNLQIPINLVTPTATLPPTSTPVTPTVAGQPTQTAPATLGPSSGSETCTVTANNAFVNELVTLINNARTSGGLPALNVNQNLATAANVHLKDMLCKNYLSHTGSDGSTSQSRVTAQGYNASLVLEDIYALPNATPQSAFNWWINTPEGRANVLNPEITEFGIAFGSREQSMLGAYFVMVSAKP